MAVWDQEFRDVCARLDGLFYRTDSRAHARHYLRGLIAPLERKNGWTIAEYSGNPEPKALQRLLNLSPWNADEARDLVCAYAMEHFADQRGVLIADPTGFAKKGDKSAGVQRQYSGTLGRIDNCQIGVFLAYVNTAGDRVLLDRELYLPDESWCADPGRRAEAHVPEKVTFATRPKQVQDMIARAVAAGVPFAWFTADEEFGQNPGLRTYLETEGIAYAMAVPKNTDTSTGAISSAATVETLVKHVASRLKPRDWSRRACGIGAKGFRVYDWALADAGDGHQYVFRRNIADGELGYFHCYNPHGEPLTELVRVIGARWPIEECFEAAKNEAGLDNYQVRLYHAWYRHITLSMLAMAFLAVMRHKAKKEELRLWTERTP
ncbi:IS701 family transposase [Amycolatopsis sp. cmx-8-4]|uniref:IS701 family transposase n=1 Tax=Amycolatopsis sp. cmx-8-4 TaxID=2790947 RepID=UPI00397C4EA4